MLQAQPVYKVQQVPWDLLGQQVHWALLDLLVVKVHLVIPAALLVLLAPLVFKVQPAQALTVLLARLGSGSLVQPVPLELRVLVLQAPRGQQVLLAQMGLRAQLAPLVCLELQALLVQRE